MMHNGKGNNTNTLSVPLPLAMKKKIIGKRDRRSAEVLSTRPEPFNEPIVILLWHDTCELSCNYCLEPQREVSSDYTHYPHLIS